MFGKPGVEFFQQQRAAGDILEMKIDLRRLRGRVSEHVDGALPAAFQPDAVQFAVAAGFDIQRHPFQRRAVLGVRLHSCVTQPGCRFFAFNPHRRGDKALHQVTLWWADIGFIDGDAIFAQHFFQPYKLAMGATVEAENRLAVEVFEGERCQTYPVFAVQQAFNLRTLRFRDKCNRFLRRQGDL